MMQQNFFCPRCGTRVTGSDFCPKCQTKIPSSATPPKPEPPQPNPTLKDKPSSPKRKPDFPKQSKPDKAKIVAIAIGAIVAAVIVAGNVVEKPCPRCHSTGKMASNAFFPTPFPVRWGTMWTPGGEAMGWYRVGDGRFFLDGTVSVMNCSSCGGDGKVAWKDTW